MRSSLQFENHSQGFSFDDLLNKFILQALEEDIGDGDLTTRALMSSVGNTKAYILIKEDCILAGMELAQLIFKILDPAVEFIEIQKDGSPVQSGTIVAKLIGPADSLLKGERLVLNCMQRMSGIATKTRYFTEKASPFGVAILDTRKTTPNFRICEKWAVAIGGGKNHRFALYDQILVKDNHIRYAGGIMNALDNLNTFLSHQPYPLTVVVEVKNEEEFTIATRYPSVNRILMDNFSHDQIRDIISRYQFSQKLEASGGINQDNFESYLQSGVHYLSIGDLTHHIRSVDISLKIE